MNELPEPSTWFASRFGEHSQRVMLGLANAGRAAHERSLDAKAGSQLTSNEAYGSFWVILPEEVAAHLAFLPERQVIRPAGSRYSLVVCAGTLVFPAKCGRGSSGANRIKLGRSDFRRRVLSLEHGSGDGVQEQLEFDFHSKGDLNAAVKEGSFGSVSRVVLVAYDVSARGGLLHVYVGEATLDSSGLVTWNHQEELPLRLLDGEGVTLVGLGQAGVGRFDDAPIPENHLTLRASGELKTAQSDTETAAGTGTEGGPHDLS